MGKGILDRLSKEYDIDVESVGFEIHPETSVAGEDLKKRFPGTEEMYVGLREKGKKYELDFGDVSIMSNSKKALLAAEYARDEGKINEFSREVFKSYFEECKNIGEDQVLEEVASKVGLKEFNLQEVMKNKIYSQRLVDNRTEGSRLRIRSVPTFIINDETMIVGAQDLGAFKRVFDRILSK